MNSYQVKRALHDLRVEAVATGDMSLAARIRDATNTIESSPAMLKALARIITARVK